MYYFELKETGFAVTFDNFIKNKEKYIFGKMKSIADFIKNDIQQNILNKRAVPTGKIPRNTSATEKMKGLVNFPLVNTRGLHNSISYKEIQDGYEVYIIGEENNFKALINSTDRMQYKIFGRPMKTPVKVPARKFFGIRTAIKKDLKKILNG